MWTRTYRQYKRILFFVRVGVVTRDSFPWFHCAFFCFASRRASSLPLVSPKGSPSGSIQQMNFRFRVLSGFSVSMAHSCFSFLDYFWHVGRDFNRKLSPVVASIFVNRFSIFRVLFNNTFVKRVHEVDQVRFPDSPWNVNQSKFVFFFFRSRLCTSIQLRMLNWKFNVKLFLLRTSTSSFVFAD